MLENDEVEWQKAMEKFRPLDDNTQLCKRLLWLENKDKPTSNGDKAKRHRNSTIIKLQQNRMNEFLYEALGHETATREGAGDIESAKASYSKGDLMQGIVERIELDFILRWEKRARLPNVLEECPNSEHPPTSALLLQVVDRCYEDYRHVDLNRGIKHLRCTPWLAPDSRPSISSNNPFPDDNYGSLAMDYEQAIFPMPAEQRKSLLLSSRTCKDGRLSSEYVEWVCSQVPDSKIESALRSRRHETYFEIKGRENSSLQTNQFFCDDTKYRRGVMLVYSEENSTPSWRYVPSQDLHRFGWFRDVTYGLKYCRYEFDCKYKTIFKVAMDGKVLALVRSEGCIPFIESTTTSV